MSSTTTATRRQGSLTFARTTQPAPTAPMKPSAPAAEPYKSFLTPNLHRCFTGASFLTIAICYLEAVLLSSSPGWFWFWSPIGITGLRTFLLFVPALAVFIVRVMNMHVGRRTTANAAETSVQKMLEVRTWATVGWYVFSAWLFGEVYIWSASKEANLGWVDVGRAYERPRVNENPVMLRSIFVILAVGQAVLHLARDYDRIPIEETESRQGHNQEASRLPEPVLLLGTQLQTIAGRVARLVFPGIVFSIPVYFGLMRQIAWNWLAYPIARILIRHLPPNTGPTAIVHAGTFVWQVSTSSAMLVALWELSSAIFTIYVAQVPLKKGQPLTSEIEDARGIILSKNKDPNGSLIRGFKAKKAVPRTFAFCELYLICTTPRFETRRKTIFSEVDRRPSTTWSEVNSFCLAEISAISIRINTAHEPVDYQKKVAETNLQRQQQEYLIAQQQQGASGLRKIAKQGVLNDCAVVLPARGGVGGAAAGAVHTVGNMAKSIGQSPDPKNLMVQYSRQAVEYGIDRAGGKDAFSRSGLQKATKSRMIQFLRTPFGEPFRQTFARRVSAVLLGVPYSNRINIVHASRSLTRLAVYSLKEDNFGQAAKDIPTLIRVYTATIMAIRKYVAELAPHWTDVHFTEIERDVESNRDLAEAGVVLEVLKAGLEEVVLAFGEYAHGLGLSGKEMREAREAIGGAREMEQMRVG